MNVSSVQPNLSAVGSASLVEAKRAALQSALLRKSVEMQQQQQVQISREAEGKGVTLDIRV